MLRNALYFGDNLEVLRKHIADRSVDLVYLDPPFNSRRAYNLIFRAPTGEESAAQMKAFSDTWRWNPATQRSYEEIAASGQAKLNELLRGFMDVLGRNDVMAYLVMMAVRLIELHRVLKDTGSIYLHCDPATSHYLKTVMDVIFGPTNYRGEIVWQRTNAHSNVQRSFGRIHDTVLYYSKSADFKWRMQYAPYSEEYLAISYRHVEPETGRHYALRDLTAAMSRASTGQIYEWQGVRPPPSRCWACRREQMEAWDAQGRIHYSRSNYPRLKVYLDEMPGVPLQDIWTDIAPPGPAERLGFETQKPEKLLERIILTSTDEGDVVLDPFCGCGTAVVAAQSLKRVWLGIDITHLAIALVKSRVGRAFGTSEGPFRDYQVVGEPTDEAGARALAEQDRDQFQWWALSLIEAQPATGERRRGPDRGVDGVVNFIDDPTKAAAKIVVQVKSGMVHVKDIREFIQVVRTQRAAMGFFLTLEAPTRPMLAEAAGEGFYQDRLGRQYPRLQVLTVADILRGQSFRAPVGGRIPHIKPANRASKQGSLLDA